MVETMRQLFTQSQDLSTVMLGATCRRQTERAHAYNDANTFERQLNSAHS